MINVAVCDDDISFSGKFESMLLKIASNEQITINIDVYFSGVELVDNILEDKQYDIIFLDIEMKTMDGLETARMIRNKDEVAILIYVTSHKSYAIEAYNVHPFQFLVKPINYEKLYMYFNQAVEKVLDEDYYFSFAYKRDFFKVLVRDILYFESKRRITYIHTKQGSALKYYSTLNKVQEELNTGKIDFWRIHQSFLVNTRYIMRKSNSEIELVNGKVLYISEDRRKEINELYIRSIEKEKL